MHSWNFRTEFEPHWDFLEAYARGWFPRNVSDFGALDKLNICDDDAPPLQPTVVHRAAEGIGEKRPWLVRNALPLVIGVVGGGAMAVVAMQLGLVGGRAAPSVEVAEASNTPYVAMAPASS